MKIENIKEIEIECIENISLAFNKLLPMIEIINRNGNIPKSKDILEVFEKKVLKKNSEVLKKKVKEKDYAKDVVRLYNAAENLTIKMRKFTLKAGYRLAIGLGNPSFIENGFAFYPTYGIPYIPGSSLKGITRNLFILIVSEHLNRDAKSVEEDLMNEKFDNSKVPLYLFEDNFGEWELQETFNVLFGTKNREGKVIFFDAFPKSLTLDDIEIDIMNPHYQPYYTNPKEKPPIDCYNPVPIHYMVLKEGVEFEFVLGVANDTDPRYLELAERLLKAVLKSFGVGAKRRKGYGWFIEEANR